MYTSEKHVKYTKLVECNCVLSLFGCCYFWKKRNNRLLSAVKHCIFLLDSTSVMHVCLYLDDFKMPVFTLIRRLLWSLVFPIILRYFSIMSIANIRPLLLCIDKHNKADLCKVECNDITYIIKFTWILKYEWLEAWKYDHAHLTVATTIVCRVFIWSVSSQMDAQLQNIFAA